MRRPSWQTIGYVGALTLCFLMALVAGWTTFGVQIDNDAYDFMFRVMPPNPGPPHSAILAIDEKTLMEMGASETFVPRWPRAWRRWLPPSRNPWWST